MTVTDQECLHALLAMGYGREEASKSLEATGGADLVLAMDWLAEVKNGGSGRRVARVTAASAAAVGAPQQQPANNATATPMDTSGDGDAGEAGVEASTAEPMTVDDSVDAAATSNVKFRCDDCGAELSNKEACEQHTVGTTHTKFMPFSTAGDVSPAEPVAADAVAQSYRCNDCGKQLRNAADVELHAARTDHANFAECTEAVRELTDAERREQVEAVQRKLKEKREAEAERERKAAIAEEKKRRLTGKQMLEAQAQTKQKEMEKMVKDRQQQKRDDLMAKRRVQEKIALDQANRRAREAGAEATAAAPATAATADAAAAAPTAAAGAPAAAAAAPPKEPTQARLQIRLPRGGTPLTHVFAPGDTLARVCEHVRAQEGTGLVAGRGFTLTTNFPPKRLLDEATQGDSTMRELDLCPSAVLLLKEK